MSKEVQTTKILKMFKERGRLTNTELNRVCYRYSARIHDLRKDGYVIASQRLHGGLWEFVYRGEKVDVQTG